MKHGAHFLSTNALAPPGYFFLECSTTIIIIQPHDVILTQYITQLHLNKYQRLTACIGNTMRIPLVNHEGITHLAWCILIVECHRSLARNNHPVLRAMLMCLVGESLAWFHGECLYLVVSIVMDDCVTSPWAGFCHLLSS